MGDLPYFIYFELGCIYLFQKSQLEIDIIRHKQRADTKTEALEKISHDLNELKNSLSVVNERNALLLVDVKTKEKVGFL